MPETMGGKPNPGTKKDKRLHENDYAMDCPDGDCEDTDMTLSGHERSHFTGEPVELAWDGSSSRFDDAQWKTATAACDTGEGTVKERCFLPHHDPGGALNRDGLAAAAGRANQASGHSPAAVAKAKAHLRSHYSQIGEPVPDNLKATVMDEVELALEKAAVDQAVIEQQAVADAQTAPWRGPICVEGQVTGDGREFFPEALTWQDPPIPLRWNKEDSHGGEPHTVAVNVGRIDRIWRDNGLIMAEGVLNLGNDNGAQVHQMIEGKFIKGVSVDADSITGADLEYVWPEDVNAGTGDEEDELFKMLFAQPEKVVYHAGRIRAATVCDIPAFAEAYIELLDENGVVVAGGQKHPELVEYTKPKPRALDGLLASGGPRDENWMPPLEWFLDPKLSGPTTIQVTDDGRVYGHAAQWGSCHIGQPDVCVQPPYEENHPYFMTGEVATREGKRVSVGQITIGTGHAPLNMGAVPATEHYDNTGCAVADIAVGNDAHGIWVAGAIRPTAPVDMVHALRAAGAVSGDWRRIKGSLRLVGLLGVNVPGFSIPKMRARVASASPDAWEPQPEALVAAGKLTTVHAISEREVVQHAFRLVMDKLFEQVHGGGE